MDQIENFRKAEQVLCLPGMTTFEMVVENGQRSYQIFVSVPGGDVPASGFPTVYMLDGNADFVAVSETMRRVTRRPAATGIHPAIVVGIGYPNTSAYDLDRRYVDFTLTGPAGSGEHDATPPNGGQVAFIDFITRQLMPHIETRFASDPQRRLLLGHSLAGYFALEVAARHPDLFSGYASFSPSLWWDGEGLWQRLEAGALKAGRSRLYLAVGRYEQETAPWQGAEAESEDYLAVREERRMVDSARELSIKLGGLLGGDERIRFELGDEEDHATIVPTFLCRALRFIQPL